MYPYNLITDILKLYENSGREITIKLYDVDGHIEKLLGELPPRERGLIEQRYKRYLTVSEVAEREGISRQRASLLINDALKLISSPALFDKHLSGNGECGGGIDYKLKISELDISKRCKNALNNAGIMYYNELKALGLKKVAEIKGLGAKSYKELEHLI